MKLWQEANSLTVGVVRVNASVIDWIRELVGEQAAASGTLAEAVMVDSEMRGELALLAGKTLLNRGSLEQAAELLAEAGKHLVDPARKAELAGQLLALAKAWTKRQDVTDRSTREEKALRGAAEASSVQALPALAQYFQRHKRLPEAIEQWREAIRLGPQEANHYLNLGRVYEQSGQPQEALAVYLDLMEVAPTARNYLVVAQRLDGLASALPEARPDQTVKIALLGSGTLDHLQSYLKVECYRAGLRPRMYQCGFDQYMQDILNPQSELYAFAPDGVICAVHASRLFPRIHHYPFDMPVEERRADMEEGLGTVQTLLDTLTQRSSALVLLHNMVAPQHPALGIQDWRDELGQTEMFAQINARLAEMVRTRYKNVYLVDEDRVQARAGKARATDPRLWLTARMGWSDAVLPGLAREYLRYLKPYKALSRKCIVVDLDRTLWGGVVGEDGMGGIQLGPDAPGNAFVAFQRELERLWRRGVLLAISTKNNEEDVLPVFEQHPNMVLKLSHFAARRINWDSKAANICDIARELNIGLDSLVFLDDNPVERAEVRAKVPQVLTVELPTDPAYYRDALLELDVFDTLALTEEDRRRNQLYAEQKARRDFEAAQETSFGSLEAYLAELQIAIEIDLANDQTLPRIAQLTNKTNQFNLTTRRYTEAQIGEMQAGGAQVYGARVTDRFGDNGLVGVAIVMPQTETSGTWDIDTLLLSCRVMGRGVETALLAFLADQARQSGIDRLRGWYLPTAKNSPVKDCYQRHGFSMVERRLDGAELWELVLSERAVAAPSWLVVRTPPALVA